MYKTKLSAVLKISNNILKNPINFLIILIAVSLVTEYYALSLSLSQKNLVFNTYSIYNSLPYLIYNFITY